MIQELAANMLPPPPPPPCSGASSLLKELPAAGIFCPYCIAGANCAFHLSAPRNPARVFQAEGCNAHAFADLNPQFTAKRVDTAMSEAATMSGAARTANSCLAFVEESMLDSISDTHESEEASTDVGASESWCDASDTSDPSPGLPRFSRRGKEFLHHKDFSPSEASKNRMQSIGDELRAYGARYSAAAHREALCRRECPLLRIC